MGIKDVTGVKFKKLGKSERVELLRDNIPSIVNFYVKKGHKDPDRVNELFEKMANDKEKIASTLLKVLKEAKDSGEDVEIGLATIIGDFLEKRGSTLDQELIDIYADVVNKLLKKRIKKLSSKLDLNKDLLKELLVIVPDKEYISNGRFVGIYVNKMLRKLYFLSKDNNLGIDSSKKLKKLFNSLFEEDLLPGIAVNILLERKESMKNFNEKQLSLWNALTDFALSVLNDLDKEEIRNNIDYYIERRQRDADRGRDFARRIQLSQISDDYSRLAKVTSKYADKDKFKRYL